MLTPTLLPEVGPLVPNAVAENCSATSGGCGLVCAIAKVAVHKRTVAAKARRNRSFIGAPFEEHRRRGETWNTGNLGPEIYSRREAGKKGGRPAWGLLSGFSHVAQRNRCIGIALDLQFPMRVEFELGSVSERALAFALGVEVKLD